MDSVVDVRLGIVGYHFRYPFVGDSVLLAVNKVKLDGL